MSVRSNLWFLLLAVFLLATQTAFSQEVVVFGADCTEAQRQALSRVFGIPGRSDRLTDVTVLTVTNTEERTYLRGFPESVIGTRAISSAYVKTGDVAPGIQVETYNITYVTPEMYASALATAGVRDAEIITAAPMAVSGTAALAGITKAFEAATGRVLNDRAKSTAHEELVTTSELGREMGDPGKAGAIVWKIKQRVIAEGADTPEEIRRIIVDVARSYGVELTEEQKQDLTELMRKIEALDLKLDDITSQLQGLQARTDEILKVSDETKSLLQRFINWLGRLFQLLFSAIGYAFRRMAGG